MQVLSASWGDGGMKANVKARMKARSVQWDGGGQKEVAHEGA